MKSKISSVTKDVDKLKNTTDNSTKKMGQNWTRFGDKLQGAGKRISTTGEKVTGFGKKWTKVTAVVGGAVAGVGASLFALTNKVTENADYIAKHSRQMGVSTKAFQEMDYWASQNGISQEQMEKAVGRLNQRMGLAASGNEKYSNALENLGINMDDVRAGTNSTEDAFEQSIKAVSEMENSQERTAAATELFGTRMARQLQPALEDGALSLEEAREKAEELGIIMSDDQIEASEKFQDSLDDIKRSLAVFGREVGLTLMPYLQDFMDYAVTKIPEVRDKVTNSFDKISGSIKKLWIWFDDLSPAIKKAMGLFAGIAAAIGPVAIAIGTVLKALGPFVTIIGKAVSWIGKMGGIINVLRTAFMALTGPIGLTIGVITALVSGIILAYKKSETFRDIIDKVVTAIKNMYNGV